MTPLAVLGISLAIALVSIAFIRFIRVRFPRHYFSLGQIIIDEREDITVVAFIFKFLPPFTFSLLLSATRIPSATQIALASSFLSSFLVIWPVLLCRDELLTYRARQRVKILYLVYVLYVTQYIVLSIFGLFVGKLIAGFELGRLVGLFLKNYSQWSSFTQNVVGGFVGAALFAMTSFIIGRLYSRAMNAFKAKIAADQAKAEQEAKQ